MNIRLVSTLTPEDENLMAPALLKALSAILDMMPIAYMIRMNTSDASVFECTQLVGRKAVPLLDDFEPDLGFASGSPATMHYDS